MATVIRSETHPDVASYGDVNRDVLKLLSAPGRGYYILLGITLIVLGIGASRGSRRSCSASACPA
jgi:hypothetical protein